MVQAAIPTDLQSQRQVRLHLQEQSQLTLGVAIDNITIDGTEIDLSSGDLTLDVAGNIVLDADGGSISMQDGGSTRFQYVLDATPDLRMTRICDSSITLTTSDADFLIRGNDGGSTITALSFDMSQAGRATFNEGIVLLKSSSAGDFGVNINTASGDSMKLQVVDTVLQGAQTEA